MPSSHLRMEEATSIIASKSISEEFRRSDVDDLEDFVLQIDENEINNEIKANGLVEDVANDVFKGIENNKEKTTEPLKTHIDTEESTKCEKNCETQDGTDNKSNNLEDKNQPISTTNINGSCVKQNAGMKADTVCQNNSEICSEIDSITSPEKEDETKSQNYSEVGLKRDESVNAAMEAETISPYKSDIGLIHDTNVNSDMEAEAESQNNSEMGSKLDGTVNAAMEAETVSPDKSDIGLIHDTNVNSDMEAEAESQNNSEIGLKLDESVNSAMESETVSPDKSDTGLIHDTNVISDMEAETESQNNSVIGLKIDESVLKTKSIENGALNIKPGIGNDAENFEVEMEENNKTPLIRSGEVTEENCKVTKGGLKSSDSDKTRSNEVKEDTNEFVTENLESVDKELDSLLSIEPEISSVPSNNSEPMEVDPPPKELPVMKTTTIEDSPSVSLELQNKEDKMDSDTDVNDHHSAPDSLTITMHSPQTLNELDENSCSNDGLIKEKIVKGFSNFKREGEANERGKEEFIYHKVKHFQVSAQSNVLKENSNVEKRIKREADEETNCNDQKKIKLDQHDHKTDMFTVKNNLEVKSEPKLNSEPNIKSEPNLVKTLKKGSDSDSESSYDTGSSTGSDSSDESANMNDTDALKKLMTINHKLIKEELSPEDLKEVMAGREKLFDNYFEGKPVIHLDRYVLEEMVLTQIIEMISYKTDVGQLRQKCRILQSEQIRLNQMVNNLKRQAENARLIIKKLIDEKANNKLWTHTAIPLKVTRSVGLQVCTCGSMTVRSKASDKECKPIKPENVITKDSSNISCQSDKNGDVSKVGPSDNKENISSNIEKDDDASNKDSNNTDDVVIVSVTENNSTSSSTNADRSNNSTAKKSLEAPKNGLVPAEKAGRKSFNVEHTNSPTAPKRSSVVSNQKKLATDSSSVDKESSKTLKTDISEIIDLTDKEDHPVKKVEASKSASASASSEKHTTAILEKTKKTISSQPNPLVTVNGIKKPSLPSSTSTVKKSIDIAPADDLVNSYDHLPKYPASPKYPPNVVKPPRPILRIGKNTSGKQGIMLSWSFEGGRNPPNIEEYQLYAYQESKNSEKLKTDTWKKVGDIKALPLPMACFLTQFVEGHKYHFIVRAVDTQKRLGDFSLPGSIILHAAGQPPSAS